MRQKMLFALKTLTCSILGERLSTYLLISKHSMAHGIETTAEP